MTVGTGLCDATSSLAGNRRKYSLAMNVPNKSAVAPKASGTSALICDGDRIHAYDRAQNLCTVRKTHQPRAGQGGTDMVLWVSLDEKPFLLQARRHNDCTIAGWGGRSCLPIPADREVSPAVMTDRQLPSICCRHSSGWLRRRSRLLHNAPTTYA